MFIDQASLTQVSWSDLAKKAQDEERAQVMRVLGEDGADIFNAAGFCRTKPVQILSPFSVPLGPLRRAWMNEFLKVRDRGDTLLIVSL